MLFLTPEKNVTDDSENLFRNITPEWAWEGSTGRGVKIAVIDSGIDYTHPELSGSVRKGVEVTVNDCGQITCKPGFHHDAYGHGTACAGIIRSIAPEVEIYSVKVLGETLSGTGNVMIAGIKWAVYNGMDLANLSLGTTKESYYPVLHKIADDAYFKNCHLVAALSNTSPVSYPAIFASIIGVKAINEDNPFNFYINPCPPVELCARGIMVRIPWLEHGYFTTSGNSFAAPVITGITALIKARHPYLTPVQLKTVLYTLASKWENYGKIKPLFYNIEDLSRISRICQEKLNIYIEQGLLVPSGKDERGNPIFYRQSVVKASRIHILSCQDFSVPEIMKKLC
jgi:subtilisin family serine protease